MAENKTNIVKKDIVDKISEKTELTKKDAEKAVNAFIDTISEELAKGKKVALAGFGTFEVVERAERKARNPKTGEEILVESKKAPKFRAGKNLKDSVNS